ncbi:hypothetical protein I7X30_05885 [Capnocytophaga sp. 051621]|uniref:Uncharacterized protein n=1 Tax=Capnocytophaga periodontitidis TaxID=2795027 RepID=A0ABS0SLC3_9FLAO|nr:hypothetical protein [Capnocytophaga periodontitidis]MBI1646586.1 hypothetical protein [Capnocytophaga periodontitidis]
MNTNVIESENYVEGVEKEDLYDGLTQKELEQIELSKKETRAGLWFSHSEVQQDAKARYGNKMVIEG